MGYGISSQFSQKWTRSSVRPLDRGWNIGQSRPFGRNRPLVKWLTLAKRPASTKWATLAKKSHIRSNIGENGIFYEVVSMPTILSALLRFVVDVGASPDSQTPWTRWYFSKSSLCEKKNHQNSGYKIPYSRGGLANYRLWSWIDSLGVCVCVCEKAHEKSLVLQTIPYFSNFSLGPETWRNEADENDGRGRGGRGETEKMIDGVRSKFTTFMPHNLRIQFCCCFCVIHNFSRLLVHTHTHIRTSDAACFQQKFEEKSSSNSI